MSVCVCMCCVLNFSLKLAQKVFQSVVEIRLDLEAKKKQFQNSIKLMNKPVG